MQIVTKEVASIHPSPFQGRKMLIGLFSNQCTHNVQTRSERNVKKYWHINTQIIQEY